MSLDGTVAAAQIEVDLPLKPLPSVEQLESELATCTDRALSERIRRKIRVVRSVGSGSTTRMPAWIWRVGRTLIVGQANEAYSHFQIELRRRFPAQLKIGPVEKIRDLVTLQLPGIPVRALPVAPRQIPYHADYVYFELDRTSDYWSNLKDSGGFAIHVGGDIHGLDLQLWAIRK